MELTNSSIKYLKHRYKRFIVYFTDGTKGYCANTGKMIGLTDENTKCLVTQHQFKLGYRWEAAYIENTWVGTNTQNPNKIVAESLGKLFPNDQFEAERTILHGALKSRFDFVSSNKIIEVKNVHWNIDRIARFPDSVTTRGTRQLQLLSQMTEKYECYVIYIVQRNDLKKAGVAHWIDPNYDTAAKLAHKNGVKFLAYNCIITEQSITLNKKCQFIWD